MTSTILFISAQLNLLPLPKHLLHICATPAIFRSISSPCSLYSSLLSPLSPWKIPPIWVSWSAHTLLTHLKVYIYQNSTVSTVRRSMIDMPEVDNIISRLTTKIAKTIFCFLMLVLRMKLMISCLPDRHCAAELNPYLSHIVSACSACVRAGFSL